MPFPPVAAGSTCVVICCYTADRWSLLSSAVSAAHQQLSATDRLLVVVDHNDALRSRLVTEMPRLTVKGAPISVIDSIGAPGLSQARNTGLNQAREEILIFLDDDAVLADGSVAAIRRRMSDPTVLAVGGAVRPDWAGGPPVWFPDEFGWVVGCDYRGMPADGAAVRNPIGAAMAVRRGELAAIGGFHQDLGRVGTLPAGCEETLMGIDLARAHPDGRLLRDTSFAVDHHVPEPRKQLRYFLSRCLHEGRSKARLSSLAGTSAAFSAEAVFLARTVTSGVLRYLGQAGRGDLSALARLSMMLLGVAVTVCGTVTGTVSGSRRTGRSKLRPRRLRPADNELPTRSPVPSDALVSVIIPTVGRDRLLGAVEAILAQEAVDLELLVVDNRPASGETRRVLAGIDDPRLRIVDQPVPGISAARNAGIAVARGAVIAFTDDDAVPDPRWVARLLAGFVEDPTLTVGSVTGRVLSTPDPTEVQAWFEEAGIFDKGELARVWARRPHPRLGEIAGVAEPDAFFPYTAGQFGSGNNMAFAADTLSAVGPFDERLGTGTPTRGGEDLDMFRTVALAGWAISYTPTAIVRHYHRDNLDELREQSYGYGVGMAAALTKLAVSRHVFALLRRVPAGLFVLLSPTSDRNQALPQAWPTELRNLELRGFAAGPFLFLRSHLQRRRRQIG